MVDCELIQLSNVCIDYIPECNVAHSLTHCKIGDKFILSATASPKLFVNFLCCNMHVFTASYSTLSMNIFIYTSFDFLLYPRIYICVCVCTLLVMFCNVVWAYFNSLVYFLFIKAASNASTLYIKFNLLPPHFKCMMQTTVNIFAIVDSVVFVRWIDAF